VFLVFTDGSCFEFSGDIQGISGVVTGDQDWARQYVAKFGGRITVFGS
jgi:hypothetical protein